MDSKRIIIFDTTLRDGEQALQASLSVKEKLQIAQALERLGVDVMEAGFPVSSPGDFQSVHTIAKEIKNSTVCALARCVTADIEAAAQALAPAERRRIHTFLSTSPLHLASKLNRTLENAIELAQNSIQLARHYTDDVEFSCEDAGRTPIDHLCRIVEMAIQAGATTINIPDTVGYTLPWEFANIIQQLFQRVPNIDRAVISVHCHDDLGMSVANSLSAIHAGARQIEGTMNGLGERAGNCALEEVIMAIKLRQDKFQLDTQINTQEIYRTSKLISQICNMPIPAHKAIIGSNAFSHSSGIHQDGILKNRATYEILTPESIGLSPKLLNLTSRSGRAAVKHRMTLLGYQDSDYNLEKLYQEFLKLADKKGQIFDHDLEALVFIDLFEDDDNYFELLNFSVTTQANQAAYAKVQLNCGSVMQQYESQGNGPIDALYQAITGACDLAINIINYKIASKGEGKEALGQVDIIVESHGKRFHGAGLATDIVAASAQALLYVLNLAWRSQQISINQRQRQEDATCTK